MGVRQRRKMEERGEAMGSPTTTTTSGWNSLLNPRGGRHAVFGLVALILVVYFWTFHNPQQWRWRIEERSETDDEIVETGFSRQEQLAVLHNLTSTRVHVLHEFCDSFGQCFDVENRYYRVREKIIAQRMIVIKAKSNLVLTMAQLNTPTVLSPAYLDPMHWKINKTVLVSTYNALQAAAGFMFGSLSLSDASRPQRVLQIGMGGGATTNFLALMPINLSIDVVELEHTVYDVARRFFELTDDSRVNVHIEDGVKFVERAVDSNDVYDSLLLDACTNDVKETILCPAAVFREPRVLENMSKIIGTSGVMSVNVFTTRDQAFQQLQIEEMYKKHFAMCFSLRFTIEQGMLFCSNRDDFRWRGKKEEVIERLEDFDFRMRTNLAKTISTLNN